MLTYDRDGLVLPLSDYEKMVIVPDVGEKDPCVFAYTDGRFSIDIMAEHATFFVLLMPPEIVVEERAEAQRFQAIFIELLARIDGIGPPKSNDLRTFCKTLVEAIKPFNDYKQRMMALQTSGKLRSLVWPSFFDHTSAEAVRWMKRLEQLAGGSSEFEMSEVAPFWTEIGQEHSGFTSHLLDPVEIELVAKANAYATQFCEFHKDCVAGSCNTEGIKQAAAEALDFDTKATRGIEAGKIKSIIDPRLADHTRREDLKFVDELKRAV